MSQTNADKFQRKLSELEKFIESVLAKPMVPNVKKKILDELQRYKARLIARNSDEAGLKLKVFSRSKQTQ